MRLAPALTGHTEEVLREILRFTGPADGTLSRYFREHPRLGSRERGVIAEAIYGLLRNKSVFSSFAESGSGPAMRRLTLLGLADAMGIDSLGGLTEEEAAWLDRVMQIDRSHFNVTMKANLPLWLWEKLSARLGEAPALALAEALNTPAPLDLRVNTIKGNRDEVAASLAEAPILTEPTPYSTTGLRIQKKPSIQNLPLFKDGTIEVQDEGSQLLAQLVGARRGEMVADFCAGAGGKTLALGAFMRNTGRLYAFDISEKRLARLKPRLARSGLSNVHPVVIAHEKDAKIKRLAGKLDRVLVDAPCSGLGTLRRNPDVKWRQTPEGVAELNVKQASILASAARMVKPGGRLVYATCSILDEENEDIVQAFLLAHPEFSLVPASQVLEEQKIVLEMGDYLKLYPHIHHTDGFFAAILERNK
ncbi:MULTISPECIES: RsmB/NOP family class I SAM-dependent RNA methyltransferase [unclassified Undibacterium]|uniref:RsmB/NOP family class I SAM-dependent RNA methyltransferase n=1 Tax=unclassified Undibacterium TaxID=2630295 RepID=UPI002AC8EF60|nr:MULTISPECIES: RsmB/NOP family class I SAM-dependent RNA methyltransferase [unclassified Undibacterium]MEB0141043.1 RsmB/NOP family class I SAM-dependent RNA methyltransferase [Undibacterium sp. CCC2.1]MEB0170533.1 RsmB/NOP family class I SAM-dependent RNA methyltransferase [Undibacterium sp. CCC1.1]MEB0174474.1 RsmB/NOP family class I SAM-dependent RNA methyltransferase [Undibacterium sp. CCC3.4]MEB0213729.1 RsmB/NOP family class I SAM-dependent RNA methyltransferase [Undibacterium sp. 5I2]